MLSTKEQVLMFLEKCGELKKCKFITATTKIKDILKCIVNSPELYRLFDAVTKDFNYPEQKARCLLSSDDGIIKRNYVVLPRTVGHRLAFIFCLFVEFDRDTFNFNDFLQYYFREDGSYFASYQAFCKLIVSALEDLIRQIYKEQLSAPDKAKTLSEVRRGNTDVSGLFNSINIAIEAEKQFIYNSNIAKDEKTNGYKLLNTLLTAVKSGDEELIDALICGYNYFILYNKCVSDGVAPLIESLVEFEQAL